MQAHLSKDQVMSTRDVLALIQSPTAEHACLGEIMSSTSNESFCNLDYSNNYFSS